MIKSFQILQERFQHGTGKVRRDFKAVAVICEDKIEAEESMWDVLVDDVLKEDPDSDSESDMKDMPVSNGESDEDEDEDKDKDE